MVSAGAADVDIVQSVLFHRHGDRSLAACIPKVPDCPSHWPQGFGQLTPRGMHELHFLGQRIRERYVNGVNTSIGLTDGQPLIVGNYTRQDLYVRSTDYDRTLQSVTSLLEGLFPPGTGPVQPDGQPGLTAMRIQPVPIHTVPQSEDGLLRAFTTATCPQYGYLQEQDMANHPEEWAKQRHASASLLHNVSEAAGMHVTLDGIWQVFDSLTVMQDHGYAWPAGITQEVYDQLDTFSRWTEARMYTGKSLRQATSGEMLAMLTARFQARVAGSAQPEWDPTSYPAPDAAQLTGPQFAIYSAHDTTLAALLYGMGWASPDAPIQNPPYASSVALELLNVTNAISADIPAGYYVRMYYNRGIGDAQTSGANTPQPFDAANIITLPGCKIAVPGTGDALCPLDRWVATVAEFASTENAWDTLCGVPTAGSAPANKPGSSGVPVGWVVAIALGSAMVAAMILIVLVKRAERRAVRLGGTGGYRKAGSNVDELPGP